MENIKTTNVERTTIENRLIQPHLIIQALAFTAILYFSVGDTLQNREGAIYQSAQSEAQLSAVVGSAVLHHAAQHSRLPPEAFQVIEAQPQTWSDKCLGLGDSGGSCTQMPVPGWHVAVASGQQRWIYRTDSTGSVIKLEGSNVSSNK